MPALILLIAALLMLMPMPADAQVDVDALVRNGSALANQGELDRALVVLNEAERAAPANPDVLQAIARVYRFRGDVTMALNYIERAYALAPTSEISQARETIRLQRGHRVELAGFHEAYSNDGGQNLNGDLILNLRLHDRVRLLLRGQAQDRFDVYEQRAGAGIEVRPSAVVLMTSTYTYGDGNTSLAVHDGTFDLSRFDGNIEWLGSFRYAAFADTAATIVSPGAMYALTDTLLVTGRYYLALTNYETAGTPSQWSHSGMGRLSYSPVRRLWLGGGYSRGAENFETLTADRVDNFLADTLSATARVDLPALTTAGFAYEYQWRDNGTTMSRITMTLAQRF